MGVSFETLQLAAMLAEQMPTSVIRSVAEVTPPFAKLLLASVVFSTLAASTRGLWNSNFQAICKSYQYDQQGTANAWVTPVKPTNVTRDEDEVLTP
eukprot:5840115-Amphidinium_carterae.1